jgi:endoglucanase
LLASEPLAADAETPLQLRVEAAGARYRFAYAAQPGQWRPLGGDQDGRLLSTRTAGGFVGAVFGLYAVSAPEGGAEAGSPIRLNQLGLLADGPKRALLPNPSPTPLPWRLLDESGVARAEGSTTALGADEASGERLHLIDFSDFSGTGDNYRLTVGDAQSRAFRIAPDLYARLPFDALSYFYHNRASTPIEARFAGGERWARPAGHAPDRATCISGSTRAAIAGRAATTRSTSAAAGTMPATMEICRQWRHRGLDPDERLGAQQQLRRPHSSATARRPSRGRQRRRRPARRGALGDGVPARHAGPDGTRTQRPGRPAARRPGLQFTEIDASGMAHHKIGDARWTALPMPPHLDPETRYLHPPSTAATLNLAATAAQCARIWRTSTRPSRPAASPPRERASRGATQSGGVSRSTLSPAAAAMATQDLSDEFYLGGAELFVTTGREEFAERVRRSPHSRGSASSEPGWASTATLGTITPGAGAQTGSAQTRRRCAAGSSRRPTAFSRSASGSATDIPYPPPLHVGLQFGAAQPRAAAALAHDFTGEARYRAGVVDAMDYLLGRNPLDRSFVSGYGARPMLHPHHRFWANVPTRACRRRRPACLSGGPNNIADGGRVARPMRGHAPPQICWRTTFAPSASTRWRSTGTRRWSGCRPGSPSRMMKRPSISRMRAIPHDRPDIRDGIGERMNAGDPSISSSSAAAPPAG